MIIGIGNRRHIANAVKFVFITAVAVTAGIHEVQHTPSHKLEFRYVTPVAVTAGIHEVQHTPSHKLEFRYVTPGVYVPDPIPPNQLVITTMSDLIQTLVVDLHGDEQKRKDYDKSSRKL